MWLSWSLCEASNNDEDIPATTGDKFRDHPVLILFEKNHVLSRIEATRMKSKRRLCFSQGDTKVDHLPDVLWECNDLEKLYLCNNSISKVMVILKSL